MIAYLLVSFAQHLGKTGWTVQRLLRIIQVNLFERRTLKALFSPDKIPIFIQLGCCMTDNTSPEKSPWEKALIIAFILSGIFLGIFYLAITNELTIYQVSKTQQTQQHAFKNAQPAT